jgi:hypothetical protein
MPPIRTGRYRPCWSRSVLAACMTRFDWLSLPSQSTISATSGNRYTNQFWPFELQKIRKNQIFIPQSPINTLHPHGWSSFHTHFNSFLIFSTLYYTMLNWTPDMQSWFDLLNTSPILSTAPNEFIDSSPIHRRSDPSPSPRPVHSFNPPRFRHHILHHMVTRHIHTIHVPP